MLLFSDISMHDFQDFESRNMAIYPWITALFAHFYPTSLKAQFGGAQESILGNASFTFVTFGLSSTSS
jgi:hypothetical protein